MAQYIKKEMADLNGAGSTKAYYQLKTWHKLEFDEFVKRCSSFHTAFKKSTIQGVMAAVCEHLAYEIANGYSVKIDGMGTFTAKLGVRSDKDIDDFDADTQKRNAQSIVVTGVSFRADKEMVKDISQNCNLERGGEKRLKKSAFTQEERIEKAREYLRENGFMHVGDYAKLTGLSYSTASRELCRIAADRTTGITSQGRKSAKLYILAPEA